MDWTSLLPKLAFWSLILFLSSIFFKYYVVPLLVQLAVEWAPLDADALFEAIHVKKLNDRGMSLYLEATLLHSRIPFPYVWATVRVPSVLIQELHTGENLGRIQFTKEFRADWKGDMLVKQNIFIDIMDNPKPLKSILKRLSVVGPGELKRINIKVLFKVDFALCDFLYSQEGIQCSKLINIGDIQDLVQEKLAGKPLALNDDHLFPDPDITPFAHPGLRGVEAGLEIQFSKPPTMNFHFVSVKCKTTLNGSVVASSVISGLKLSSDSSTARMSIEIQPPSALSNRPISGAVSSVKGILKGIVKGAVNGLLFNDW